MILARRPQTAPTRRPTLRVFLIGLLTRLVGLGLIMLGDGHDDLGSKALVVVGVIISVTGIGILRYLLMRDWPLLKKIKARSA